MNDKKICSFPGLKELVSFIEAVALSLWERFVQQFKEDSDYDAGWRCEYWGKMMRGACFVYSYSQNPRLYEVLTDTVKDLLSAQDELGRISSYAVSHEFDGWDLWGRKYVLLACSIISKSVRMRSLKTIVKSMCRRVDYLISRSVIEGWQILITRATRHWRGLNSHSGRLYGVQAYKGEKIL